MATLEGQVQIMTIIIIDHGLSNDEVETRFQEHYFSPLTLALKIKNFQSHKGNFWIFNFFFVKSWGHGHSIFSWNFTPLAPFSGQPERFFEKKIEKKILGENFKNAPIRPQGPLGSNYYTIRYHYLVPPHTTPFDQILRFWHSVIWYTFLPNRLLKTKRALGKNYLQLFTVDYNF